MLLPLTLTLLCCSRWLCVLYTCRHSVATGGLVAAQARLGGESGCATATTRSEPVFTVLLGPQRVSRRATTYVVARVA